VSNELDWIRQYRAALNEADASKRLAPIEEAERTLKRALRLAIEKGDSDQRHAIAEALHQLSLLREPCQEERNMNEKIERSGCRFSVKNIEGRVEIQVELFHATVPTLASANLSFEVLRGIKPEQARALVDKMNDVIVGVALTPKSPM
jgi:hypothetical protein